MITDLGPIGVMFKQCGIEDYFINSFYDSGVAHNVMVLAAIDFSIMLYKEGEIKKDDILNLSKISKELIDKYDIWFVRKLASLTSFDQLGFDIENWKINGDVTATEEEIKGTLDLFKAITMCLYDIGVIEEIYQVLINSNSDISDEELGFKTVESLKSLASDILKESMNPKAFKDIPYTKAMFHVLLHLKLNKNGLEEEGDNDRTA